MTILNEAMASSSYNSPYLISRKRKLVCEDCGGNPRFVEFSDFYHLGVRDLCHLMVFAADYILRALSHPVPVSLLCVLLGIFKKAAFFSGSASIAFPHVIHVGLFCSSVQMIGVAA